jgi:hypothetical protein
MVENPEVVSELLRAAERLYTEEDARFRYAEGKAGVLVAASGAALLAVLSKTPDLARGTTTATCIEIMTGVAAVVLLTAAFALGTISLLPRDVKRIGAEGIPEEAAAFQDILAVRKHLLELYSEATQRNVEVTDAKMRLVTAGIVLLSLALLVMAAAFVVQLSASVG